MGGVNVEKAQLVRACGIIGARGIDGVACVHQIDKVHALDHTAIGDIKAGDDAGFQHGVAIGGRGVLGKVAFWICGKGV